VKVEVSKVKVTIGDVEHELTMKELNDLGCAIQEYKSKLNIRNGWNGYYGSPYVHIYDDGNVDWSKIDSCKR